MIPRHFLCVPPPTMYVGPLFTAVPSSLRVPPERRICATLHSIDRLWLLRSRGCVVSREAKKFRHRFRVVMSDAPKSTVEFVSPHGRLPRRRELVLVSTIRGVGVASFSYMKLPFWGTLQSARCVPEKDPYHHRNAEPNCQDCHGVPFRAGCESAQPACQIYTMIG